VDADKQLVRIPEEVVMRALVSAGKTFTLYGRDLARTAAFGVGQRNCNSIAGEAMWLDEAGGERRSPDAERRRRSPRGCASTRRGSSGFVLRTERD